MSANARVQRRPKSSRFKGVRWAADRRLWHAYINLRGRRTNLGYYADEREAARAYDRAARGTFGSFARPNLRGLGDETRL
jgi:hypothetical protein